eukprot:gnl/MRDRNA2_/MRDRNA2_69837_c0_seq1.p1 gnl/MRDRNA2_/MRDRNA2_69837_c0~~gnl/MRDRNA2_/MRDRNA2_69837_c0_seq1.p1  ORF type:complete len:375 (+),score=62.54 gnl/MRDRNA2_/MRDRNA2_69837_c0_seq1:111-1235(+)
MQCIKAICYLWLAFFTPASCLRRVSMGNNHTKLLVKGKTNVSGKPGFPVCTEDSQRIGRKNDWWNFRERLGPRFTRDLGHGECLNLLGDLEWVQAVDGWAQAAFGAKSFHAFNGTKTSKDVFNNDKVKGDFLSDHWEMLQRIAAVGDKPLHAAAVETVNAPVLSRQFRSGCVSNFDPMTDLEKSHSDLKKSCRRASLDPKIAEQQLRDLDPHVYDAQGNRHPEPTNQEDIYKERLGHLQRYLDDYNQKIIQLPPDDHVNRLKALAKLKWRMAWLHAFCDGNGRTRELVIQRELCRLGYHPVVSFDNNGELFYQTLPMIEDQLVESFFLWEDAYAFNCIPWTPDRANQHRANFGAKATGLPEYCSSETVHRHENI